jgi:glutaredoxin-related protein
MSKESKDFENLSSWRNAAAGLIKSFIRARAVQEPGFLDTKDYKRWGIPNLKTESRTTTTLLRLAQRLRDNFEKSVLEGQVSIPEPSSAVGVELTDSILEKVCGFVRWSALS